MLLGAEEVVVRMDWFHHHSTVLPVYQPPGGMFCYVLNIDLCRHSPPMFSLAEDLGKVYGNKIVPESWTLFCHFTARQILLVLYSMCANGASKPKTVVYYFKLHTYRNFSETMTPIPLHPDIYLCNLDQSCCNY